jgi:hypothetical protein
MARLVITPTAWANNKLNAFSFTSASSERWYIAPGDYPADIILIGYSTHSAALGVTICAGSSEAASSSYMGQDFIYKGKGDLSTSIASSGIAVLFIDAARFKSSGGIYIDSTEATYSTAITWAAFYTKPKL